MISIFCFQKSESPDFGRRGAGNFTVAGRLGTPQQDRLIFPAVGRQSGRGKVERFFESLIGENRFGLRPTRACPTRRTYPTTTGSVLLTLD